MNKINETSFAKMSQNVQPLQPYHLAILTDFWIKIKVFSLWKEKKNKMNRLYNGYQMQCVWQSYGRHGSPLMNLCSKIAYEIKLKRFQQNRGSLNLICFLIIS